MDEEFDMFRPQGLCARCSVHPATELWELYGRRSAGYAYEFRCRCCAARGKLERAKAARDRIPALEEALATAEKECASTENQE